LILDTTYLLPLARIGIDADLLDAIAKGHVDLEIEDITVSLISIFELQAKAAKLKIPVRFTIEAVETIFAALRVEPFYEPAVIEISYDLRKMISDYVDCVVVATAVVLKEDLVTEDSVILNKRETIEETYSIKILCFKDLARQ